MTESLLKLGTFSFEGLESPERIVVSSKQRIALHHLGSGFTVADCLGEDIGIVTFRGIFSGAHAEDRVRAVEYLKLQGSSLPLTWRSKTLLVVIRDFELNYSSSRWIPYKLCCIVTGSHARNNLTGSPDKRVNDMIGLMQNAGLSPTASQTAAVLGLAAMNYDVAPSDQLNQANTLLSSINTQIAELGDFASDISEHTSISEGPANYIAEVGANVGYLASSFLARNRLMEIIVRAQNRMQS
jgi:hypothetical protein